MADVTRSWRSVAFTAAVLGLLAFAAAAQGAFPGRNGFIAYVHSASGSQGEEGEGPSTFTNALMVGRLFGQERFTLRTCTRVDDVPQEPACDTSYDSPAYSPIGDRLLVDAGERLAILASDGSDFRPLPQQTANDGAPAWAPDGERFVFTGVAEGASEPDLYIYNLARDRSRRLTTTGGAAPAWSSRNRIAYVTGYSAPVAHAQERARAQLVAARDQGRLRPEGQALPDRGQRQGPAARGRTAVLRRSRGRDLVAGRTPPCLPRLRGRHHGRRRDGTP